MKALKGHKPKKHCAIQLISLEKEHGKPFEYLSSILWRVKALKGHKPKKLAIQLVSLEKEHGKPSECLSYVVWRVKALKGHKPKNIVPSNSFL